MSVDKAMKSPCIGVCKLDGEGKYCVGCGRTVKQITDLGKRR